jgi:hypothetical protein
MLEFTFEMAGCHTEPSADRGPQRGSPAGVVDAPDARVYFGNERKKCRPIPKLTLGIRRYRARFCIECVAQIRVYPRNLRLISFR